MGVENRGLTELEVEKTGFHPLGSQEHRFPSFDFQGEKGKGRGAIGREPCGVLRTILFEFQGGESCIFDFRGEGGTCIFGFQGRSPRVGG